MSDSDRRCYSRCTLSHGEQTDILVLISSFLSSIMLSTLAYERSILQLIMYVVGCQNILMVRRFMSSLISKVSYQASYQVCIWEVDLRAQ